MKETPTRLEDEVRDIYDETPQPGDHYHFRTDDYYDFDEDRYWDVDYWYFDVDDTDEPMTVCLENMKHFGGELRVSTRPKDPDSDIYFERTSRAWPGKSREYLTELIDSLCKSDALTVEELDRMFPRGGDWYEGSNRETCRRLGWKSEYGMARIGG